MSAHDHHDEYGETFVAGLEWMWGERIPLPGHLRAQACVSGAGPA